MTVKKPTIDDVARESGVGRTTVSRVLNGGPNVRDEVRERVHRAVKALNYKVNPQARSLAGGGSRMLALILASDLEAEPNSFYASALELGALRECLSLGYQLLTRHVPQQSPDRRQQVLELMTTQRCQGVILTPPFADDAALIEEIRRHEIHVVTISPGGPGRAVADGVGIDDEIGGYDIARHLLALGHRRFGFIGGIAGHLSAEQRFDGLKRAMLEQGLDPTDIQMVRGDFTFRSGVVLTTQLLDGPQPPTALICANDDMAAGALSTAHGRGLDVPGDLSITGFDDTPVSEIVWPPLTTVHQPLKAMGREAVLVLAGRLSGTSNTDWRFTTLPHAVVSRRSADRVLPKLVTAKA
ncbi:MAG: LacI family DNA-binding transcriptional regulator [Brevundimonas sp.]|nr:MAG: LacI family DNA-binding transcriptional regulator [Brevundimonas sp.]